MTTKGFAWLPLLIIIATVAVAGSVGYVMFCEYNMVNSNSTGALGVVNTSNPNTTNVTANNSNSINSTNSNIEEGYSTEQFCNKTTSIPTNQSCVIDSRILFTDSNGTEVLASSTIDAIGHYVIIYSIPEEGTEIFLKTSTPETDGDGGELWSFNKETKKFTELSEINKTYIGWGKSVLDSKETKLIYIPDSYALAGMKGNSPDQIMYLYNLQNDSVRILVQLSSNETFNAGWGALSSVYEVSWKDSSTVRYSIYDQNSGIRFDEHKKKIGDREINIYTNSVTDVTDDWQTYTNEEYGFSFRYPVSWIINIPKGSENFRIQVWPVGTEPDVEVAEIIEVMDVQSFATLENETSRNDVTINNLKVTQITGPPGFYGDRVYSYFPLENGRYIQVSWYKDHEDDNPEFSQILSTFQFTN